MNGRCANILDRHRGQRTFQVVCRNAALPGELFCAACDAKVSAECWEGLRQSRQSRGPHPAITSKRYRRYIASTRRCAS